MGEKWKNETSADILVGKARLEAGEERIFPNHFDGTAKGLTFVETASHDDDVDPVLLSYGSTAPLELSGATEQEKTIPKCTKYSLSIRPLTEGEGSVFFKLGYSAKWIEVPEGSEYISSNNGILWSLGHKITIKGTADTSQTVEIVAEVM